PVPKNADLGVDERQAWDSYTILITGFGKPFIASAARHLPASDVWCILYPSLRHFLKSDVAEIDEQSLLTAMKPPVSV
ncbi:hypothetical protein MPER_04136, partial [Moniliophthora perniciosa FA553]